MSESIITLLHSTVAVRTGATFSTFVGICHRGDVLSGSPILRADSRTYGTRTYAPSPG